MTAPGTRQDVSTSSAFETTRWTLVVQAGAGDAAGREALEMLCRAYWLPLYVYARRRGHSAHDAEDLTQGFLADMIRRDAIRQANPARGRFRTFLLTAFSNYLHNAHDHAHAERRGGDIDRMSIDAAQASGALDQVQADGLSPDQAFDRSWALALFDRALRRLRAEQEKLGKGRWFDRLRPMLQGGPRPGDYDAIAAEFGVTKNVVTVTIHRLGGRYRQLVRAEIAETVSEAETIEEELRSLLDSL